MCYTDSVEGVGKIGSTGEINRQFCEVATPSPSATFYNINSLIAKNKLFNFIVGARSIGKTYATKALAIDNFINHGEQFVYIRRFKTELKKIKTFFNDISKQYQNHEFSCDGKQFFIDKKIAGYAINLTTAKIEKSVSYDGVTTIIFDEFIIDKGFQRYIPDEVTNFFELYVTISRGKDIPVYFIANSITDYNPYFIYFDVTPNGFGFTCKGDLLIENVDPKKYSSTINTSRFAALVKNTEYGNYLLNNVSLRDTENFIQKKTQGAKHIFNFVYNGNKFGVWLDKEAIYISFDTCDGYTIALTENSITADTVLDISARSPFRSKVVKKYQKGQCYFESAKIKGLTLEIIKKFLAR